MLTVDEVRTIFEECLFRDGELVDGKGPEDAVIVEGILHTFGFHPERLQENKGKIVALLKELSPNFSIGGGWSFLNLPFDKNENQWGGQMNAEQLLALGIGIGKARFLLPREYWKALPGGVPYLEINT